MTTPSYFPLPTGTTDQRPATPAAGYMRFNTTVGKIEVYNGQAWTDVIIPSIRRIKELQDLEGGLSGEALLIVDQFVAEPNDYVTYQLSVNNFFGSDSVQESVRDIAAANLRVATFGGFGTLTYDADSFTINYQGTLSGDIWSVMGVQGPNLAYDGNTGVYSFSADPVFDSVTTGDLMVENIDFTGSGPVNLFSGNDLNFDAEGRITFLKPIHLPRYTRAELATITDVEAGAIAICTDPIIGTARPVVFNGTEWRDFANGNIDIVEDF